MTCGWGTTFIITLEVFYLKLKLSYSPCIAGGLFTLKATIKIEDLTGPLIYYESYYLLFHLKLYLKVSISTYALSNVITTK